MRKLTLALCCVVYERAGCHSAHASGETTHTPAALWVFDHIDSNVPLARPAGPNPYKDCPNDNVSEMAWPGGKSISIVAPNKCSTDFSYKTPHAFLPGELRNMPRAFARAAAAHVEKGNPNWVSPKDRPRRFLGDVISWVAWADLPLHALRIIGTRLFLPCALRLAECTALTHVYLTCVVWEIAPSVLSLWATLPLKVLSLDLELHVGGAAWVRGEVQGAFDMALWFAVGYLLPEPVENLPL